MIGLPIGLLPIGSARLSSVAILTPNIILSGTLDFGYSFRIPNRVNTYLNFGVILGDDNVVQVNLTSVLTGLPINPSAATVAIYAPGTNSNPVITKSTAETIVGSGYFQFALPHDDTEGLAAEYYPWFARITLPDLSVHTVNCGDINLTTGILRVVGRPS